MNICEATKLARKEHKAMARKIWPKTAAWYPLDSEDVGILAIDRFDRWVTFSGISATELTCDDWELRELPRPLKHYYPGRGGYNEDIREEWI